MITRKTVFLILGILLVIFYDMYAVTLGEFTFIDPNSWGLTFNSQWQHLIHGHFDVDPSVTPETYIVNGKAMLYWGIFPAIVRGFLSFFYDLSLPMSRASVFLALMIVTLANVATAFTLGLHKGTTKPLFWVLLAVLVFGNPFVTIVAPASPYHETILWSAAGLALFNLLLIGFALNPERRPIRKLILMGLAATIALLSRAPEGVAAFVALALIGAGLVWRQRFPKIGRRGIAVVCIAWIIGGALHLAVNQGRFGNPFETQPIDKLSYLKADNDRVINYKKYGLWQLDRVPAAFEFYFVPHADNFSSKFPYVLTGTTLHLRRFPKNFDWIEPQTEIPLTITGAFFVFFGMIGMRSLFSGRTARQDVTREILLIGGIGNIVLWIIIAGYAALCYRYSIDLLTPFVYFTFVGLYLKKKTADAGSTRKINWISAVLAVITIYTSLATYAVYVIKNDDYDIHKREALYNRLIRPLRGVDLNDDGEIKYWQ